MSGKVKCTCGWSWNKSDSSKKDMYICHECGRDNSNNMRNGGWLDNYADGGSMQEHQENYNDSKTSAPEGMVGDGFSNVGRNYSPAWGGSFQEGGEIPNAQSGRATRADSLAVYNNTKAIDDYYRKQGYTKEKVKDSKNYKEKIKNRKEWVNSAQKYLKEAKNAPVDTFYTQTDKNNNIAEQKKYLKEAQKRLSETIEENNPKNYIKKLEDSKKIFETKTKDVGRYIDEQNNLVEGKPSIEKFYTPIDENKFYQREQSQGFLDLRSPIPFYDKRITPQDLSRFKSPDSVLGEQILDKIIKSNNQKEKEALEKQMDALVYSDNVEMYEYDPLAVMPFDMVPLEQQEERIRKYGSSGVPTSVIQQHPEWVNANTKPIANPTKLNVEGLKPMSVAGLQDVDNRFETNLKIPTPVQRKPKYYNITDVNNQYGGGDTQYRVDSLDELRELPKEQWDRKITPHYQMGGNIYPVNYVPQAQGGMSMPGAVGFTYARTQGIPSNGPYAKKTKASAQNGQEMQYYREGLDWKPKSISQEGTQVGNSRQKRGLDLLIKETELAKKDRQELNRTGQIKKPLSLYYKKLAPKQQPTLSQDKMSVVDRQKANNAMEQVNKEQLGLLERPLIYLANPDKVLGDIGIPGMETSEEDRQKIMLNRYNPFQSNQDRLLNTVKMGLDYVPKATVNTALAAAFIPESSGVLGLLNETLNPLAGSGDNLIRIKSAANRFINNRLTIPSAINDAVRITDDAIVGTAKDKSKELISEIDWSKWNEEIPNNFQLMKEYNAIEQTTKANGSWMKNPDGSAFQGTPEQFVQQNSENFKKAFPQGSNVSYRGDLSNLSEIKSQQELGKEALKRKYNLTDQDTEALEKLWERSKDKLNSGKYTTNDYDAALNYAKGDKNKVLSLYTDIRNPKFTETGESFRVLEKDRQKLLSEGYDALITKPSSFYPEGENVLLKNNQIKSATGNNGMFDMTNPNIYKSILPVGLGLGAASQMGEEEPLPEMRKGGVIKDDNGYWNPENWGSPVEIGSNNITMQNVPFDVLGISDEGDVQHMKANSPKNYKYKGKKVTEFPMAKNGIRQEQKGLVNLDNLLNFTNYNKPQPGGWLNKYN